MNFSQIANNSTNNLQEQTILNQKSEINKLNGLVLKLNEENQRNHEKIIQAETLKKENRELIQQAENLSQTNSKLQKTISDQKEKINRLKLLWNTVIIKDVINVILTASKKNLNRNLNF